MKKKWKWISCAVLAVILLLFAVSYVRGQRQIDACRDIYDLPAEELVSRLGEYHVSSSAASVLTAPDGQVDGAEGKVRRLYGAMDAGTLPLKAAADFSLTAEVKKGRGQAAFLDASGALTQFTLAEDAQTLTLGPGEVQIFLIGDGFSGSMKLTLADG